MTKNEQYELIEDAAKLIYDARGKLVKAMNDDSRPASRVACTCIVEEQKLMQIYNSLLNAIRR